MNDCLLIDGDGRGWLQSNSPAGSRLSYIGFVNLDGLRELAKEQGLSLHETPARVKGAAGEFLRVSRRAHAAS